MIHGKTANIVWFVLIMSLFLSINTLLSGCDSGGSNEGGNGESSNGNG